MHTITPAKHVEKPAALRAGASGLSVGANAGAEDLLRFRIVGFVLYFPFLSSSAGRGVLGPSGRRGSAVPDARPAVL
ncbi:hypothetical protein K438DRAFT_1978694 [Mycena galopus ATCC 62051]|nr:hypothetical protein K438DRAFT_1978694 [Mycena galopus ATCC 62051]